MLLSEIETLVNQWFVGEYKVFIIRYTFAEPDTLIIYKCEEDLYRVDLDRSTTRYFKKFGKEELVIRIRNGSLEYKPYMSIHVNYRTERANGCECGAWKTTEPNCHSPICKHYKGGY